MNDREDGDFPYKNVDFESKLEELKKSQKPANRRNAFVFVGVVIGAIVLLAYLGGPFGYWREFEPNQRVVSPDQAQHGGWIALVFGIIMFVAGVFFVRNREKTNPQSVGEIKNARIVTFYTYAMFVGSAVLLASAWFIFSRH